MDCARSPGLRVRLQLRSKRAGHMVALDRSVRNVLIKVIHFEPAWKKEAARKEVRVTAQMLNSVGFVEKADALHILFDRPRKTVQELMDEPSEADNSMSGEEWVRSRSVPTARARVCAAVS
jgi:hypothetical protein